MGEEEPAGDRLAEKRMTLVFLVVGVILLISILNVLRQRAERPNLVKKGSTVASQQRTNPLRNAWNEADLATHLRKSMRREN